MIPHIIHYCWFGGNPLPNSAKKCIASWKKFLPEYEIKEWNESNFNVNSVPYTAEAYKQRKYAFVSDYARFWILYNYGGVYFDTDVELIKPMASLLNNGAYLGFEARSSGALGVNPGLGAAAEPQMAFYSEILNKYSVLAFNPSENIVTHTTSLLSLYGLACNNERQTVCDITIYPSEYFCPIDYDSRRLRITENTYSIHHYDESWLPKRTRVINFIGRLLGPRVVSALVRLKHALKNG